MSGVENFIFSVCDLLGSNVIDNVITGQRSVSSSWQSDCKIHALTGLLTITAL